MKIEIIVKRVIMPFPITAVYDVSGETEYGGLFSSRGLTVAAAFMQAGLAFESMRQKDILDKETNHED